jgi:hypothetical protein
MIQRPVGILLTAAVAASSGAVTGWLAALFVDWLGILIWLTE